MFYIYFCKFLFHLIFYLNKNHNLCKTIELNLLHKFCIFLYALLAFINFLYKNFYFYGRLVKTIVCFHTWLLFFHLICFISILTINSNKKSYRGRIYHINFTLFYKTNNLDFGEFVSLLLFLRLIKTPLVVVVENIRQERKRNVGGNKKS